MDLKAYCIHIIVYIVALKDCTYSCFKSSVCIAQEFFKLIILR